MVLIKKISDQLNCNYYTDHLCITRSPGIKFSHLTPIIYNESYLKRITANVAYVQDFLGKQLVLENITTPFNLEKNEMSYFEFMSNLVKNTGCGTLFDATNFFANNYNHGDDTDYTLENLSQLNIVHMHLSGGFIQNDRFWDSHSEPISDTVWELLDKVLDSVKPSSLIIERDDNLENTNRLFTEVSIAKEKILKINKPIKVL